MWDFTGEMICESIRKPQAALRKVTLRTRSGGILRSVEEGLEKGEKHTYAGLVLGIRGWWRFRGENGTIFNYRERRGPQ